MMHHLSCQQTLQSIRGGHLGAVTREQRVPREEEPSPDCRHGNRLPSPRRTAALQTPKLPKMFGGGLAPCAVILNAVWLGTLLRVSQAALYTNDWAIKIKADAEAVRRIAEKHGFANLGQVGGGRQRLVGARQNSNSSNILFLWSPSAVS